MLSPSWSTFPAIQPVFIPALQLPAQSGIIIDIDGDNLDGQRNRTITNGQSLPAVTNNGSRGGTATAPGTAPKAKITVNSSGVFGSILYAGGDFLQTVAGSSFGPCWVCVVVKPSTLSAGCTAVGGLNGSTLMEVNMDSTRSYIFCGNTVATSNVPSATQWNILIGYVDPGQGDSWLDLNDPFDNHSATGNFGTNSATGLTIGSNFTNANPLPAGSELHRVIVWSGALPSSPQDILNYFYQKLGVGWPKSDFYRFQLTGTEVTPKLQIHGGNIVDMFGDSKTLGSPGVTWWGPAQTAVNAGVGTPCTFNNRGVGGNKFTDLIARFNTDVVPDGPQVVAVECSVNDAAANVPIDVFMANVATLDNMITGAGIKQRSYNSLLCRKETYPDPLVYRFQQYAYALRHVCWVKGATYIPVREAQQVYESVTNVPAPGNIFSPGPLGQTLLTPDGVHDLASGATLESGAFMGQAVLSG